MCFFISLYDITGYQIITIQDQLFIYKVIKYLLHCNLHKQRVRFVVMTFSHQIQHCFGTVHLKYKMCVTKTLKGFDQCPLSVKIYQNKTDQSLKFYFHNT